jgi:hypothetical protein
METAIFEIKLKDGRIFRIFCANKTQVREIISLSSSPHNETSKKVSSIRAITTGIHTAKQFKQISKTI